MGLEAAEEAGPLRRAWRTTLMTLTNRARRAPSSAVECCCDTAFGLQAAECSTISGTEPGDAVHASLMLHDRQIR